ncbi:GCN5-related N-acetyltransferase [Alloactinosynnema sp. L-07]|uniref:GNAT family N-acetyltransferase n=1 Tax=Alloactinosynnema sp. L-07 TaxID=1653480 RepID=UPI00065EFEFC|nr:GNAT family N-acetyltransferase [Alloactinosynnema sp. L-07]CRK58554.1 GCN5-related N-acetyltransferase [Alloactinosynnema sp. L-07]
MTTLEWRPLRAGDSAAWVDLCDAAEAVDKTGEFMGDEEFAEVMADLGLVTVAAFDGDQMVATGVSWFKAGHVKVNSVQYEATVRPSHRRRGIGRELLDRLTAAARAHHDQRCPHLTFEPRSSAHESNEGHAALLTTAGYQPIRYYFDMRVDLATEPHTLALPDGLTARTFDPADDEHLRVVHNACFAEHWGSIPSQPDYWRAHMTGNPSFRPEHTVLLFDEDDKIVAYVMGYASRAQEAGTGQKELWLGHVGTVKPWRGKGVGTALLASVLTGAKVAGFDRAALAVDSGNATGALGVYERCGFRVTDRWTTYSLSR